MLLIAIKSKINTNVFNRPQLLKRLEFSGNRENRETRNKYMSPDFPKFPKISDFAAYPLI